MVYCDRPVTAWIDPNETRSNWGQDQDDTLPDRARPTIERAAETGLPFQYREQRHFDGTLSDVRLDGIEYTSGEYVVNGGVMGDHALKLHARGLIWVTEEPAQCRRFKLQVVRDSPPADTVPYGDYDVWQRYQFGSVTVDPIEGPTFEPDDNDIQTERTTAPFGALLKPVRLHVSELELIRNPSFAQYRLEEREEWEEYGAVFRWKGNAFQQRVE